MKVKVFTKLVKNGETFEYEMFGIFRKNTLSFLENGVHVSFDFENSQMMREDSSIKFMYKFLEKCETLNEVFVKEFQKSISIPIRTLEIQQTLGHLHLVYELLLEKEKISYDVVWEEVK